MSGARLLVAFALVLGACGRIDFDPRVDSSSATVDALDACGIRHLAVGEGHICALRNDGEVYCAGENAEGQLGTGVLGAAQPTPVRATEWVGLSAAVATIHTGRQFSCVRDQDGMVFCVGDNDNRQLGTAATSPPTPTRVAAVTPPLSSVSLGASHGCGITLGGQLICWGDSDEGQGGLGISPNSHTPEVVTSLTAQAPVHVSAGTDHVCAATSGTNMFCWGDGGLNRLGFTGVDSCPNATAGPITCQTTPTKLGISGAAELAAGHEHSCSLQTNGDVFCWGSNDRSQTGQPPTTSSGITLVAGAGKAVQVVAGRHFNCARDDVGAVRCWGAADLFQLGSSIAQNESATPVVVSLQRPATALASHPMTQSACAVLDDGSAWCWGANDSGQLGRGTMTTREIAGPFVVPCD